MTSNDNAGEASFRTRFEAASARNGTLLCVGLDPDRERIPEGVSTLDFLTAIVEATADLVCAYKPNSAFFEAEGPAGMETLRTLIERVPDEVPVLLDAKRGDVGHTAEAYARAVFDVYGADAVTASPYLGRDSVEPFLARAERHTFLLCRTSNPAARDLQDLPVDEAGTPLYLRVAELANSWNERGNVGLVVGATYPEEAARIRERCPDLLFLLPGVGAQQGDIDAAVEASIDADGGGALVSASRGVLYAGGGGDFASAARRAALELRERINAARSRTAMTAKT